MPLITIKPGTPLVPAGTYLADLVAIDPKRMVTSFSKNGEEQDFLEWTWLVHTPNDAVEVKSLTSTSTAPKSRIVEYLTALLGAEKVVIDAGFDEKDLVGKSVMVQTIVTDQGFTKIDKIISAPKSGKAPTTPHEALSAAAPGQVAAPDLSPDTDDLPF